MVLSAVGRLINSAVSRWP